MIYDSLGVLFILNLSVSKIDVQVSFNIYFCVEKQHYNMNVSYKFESVFISEQSTALGDFLFRKTVSVIAAPQLTRLDSHPFKNPRVIIIHQLIDCEIK